MKPWLIIGLACCGLSLALVPFGLVARARVTTSDKPRLHVIRDMDNQDYWQAQHESSLFADKRSMRAPVPGTVAQGELYEDTHFYQGRVSQAGKLVFSDAFPAKVTVDDAFLARGQERFEVFCAPCHGFDGAGGGMVHERVMALKFKGVTGMEGWAAPVSVHADSVRPQPVGYLFNVITNGVRNMSGYRSQIPAADRWAIVAYVKALQFTKNPE